jgi:hypothetical protein
MGVISCGTTMLDQGVFQNIGAVTWDTTAKTSNFTGVSGNGYFVNTTSGAVTVTLPSSPSAGNIVGIKDYANTADTNNITIGRNGSNIQGTADDFKIKAEGGSAVLLYVDGTQGWKVISESTASAITNQEFTVATGGTITTSGDFKIHTFTGPGTFSVSSVGNAPGGGDKVSYAVVAGGGGSGRACAGGGGGAGGYREGKDSPKDSYTASPIVAPAGLTVSASPGSYPITVGGGGAVPGSGASSGSNGSPSTFSSITSAGGGFGHGPSNGGPGGSGGGGGGQPSRSGGTGNQPPVSPAQGTNGGTGFWTGGSFGEKGGGGGGATDAGTSAGPGPGGTAPGGDGATSSIDGSSTTRAGGGGGGNAGATPAASSGGPGGGGPGGCSSPGTAGTANTGGGGGGSGSNSSSAAAGGSGVVIIRYKFQ